MSETIQLFTVDAGVILFHGHDCKEEDIFNSEPICHLKDLAMHSNLPYIVNELRLRVCIMVKLTKVVLGQLKVNKDLVVDVYNDKGITGEE